MAETIFNSTSSNKIYHGMLIDLTVNGTTYCLSNLYTRITLANGNDYRTMGSFLNITDMQNDLRATNNQLTVSLSGIPTSDDTPNFLNIVLNEKIKGSRIVISRIFFPNGYIPSNSALLSSYVYQRYNGYVSNYSLGENWDQDNRLVSNTISLQCSNINAIIEKQYTGRRTNQGDQDKWFSGDTGFYRVKLLADTQFDFGKPYVAPASGASSGGGTGGDTTYSYDQP
jgi:hypothetical protein